MFLINAYLLCLNILFMGTTALPLIFNNIALSCGNKDNTTKYTIAQTPIQTNDSHNELFIFSNTKATKAITKHDNISGSILMNIFQGDCLMTMYTKRRLTKTASILTKERVI